MRFAISAMFLYPQEVGGAEQVLYNLIGGLAEVLEHDTVDVFSPVPLRPDLFDGVRLRNVVVPRPTNRFAAETWVAARHGRSYDAWLFTNYFLPPTAPLRRSAVIIHDAQFRHLPQFFTAKKRAWLRLTHRFSSTRAARVVAISEFVRSDLAATHGRRAAARLRVIGNPIDFEALESDRVQPADPPTVLSVSAHYPHKNLDTLIRAVGVLRDRGVACRLELVGSPRERLRGIGGGSDPVSVIAELGLAGVVTHLGFVDAPALADAYARARCFAFPSLFEGFGMPAVEALGLGLDVVTTRATSLPAVTQGLAVYVDDPRDPVEWADRLEAVLRSPGGRRDDVARQVRQSYGAAVVARDYLELMRETAVRA